MPDPDVAESPLREIYTVSQLNLEARRLIESSFAPLWIEGEISNLARPRSGHLYFSLKDEHCQVRCAMFRMHNRHLDFEPSDGAQVLAQARVGLYAERGEFQLVVQYLEEAGTGALRRAFDALKRRLENEGLFAPERKQALPAVPGCIGILTSPTGAALRDVLSVIRRRYPGADILIHPIPVQGAGAAERIARMLDVASERSDCDLLIIARGGGSLEDLWAFNEEVVARAISRCRVPVVTGIGHEVDFTIADLVADVRGATPSAAAELATPNAADWGSRVAAIDARLNRIMTQRLQRERQGLHWLERRLEHPRRRLYDLVQRLDERQARLARVMHLMALTRRAALGDVTARLLGFDPARVLRTHRVESEHLASRLQVAGASGLAQRRSSADGLHRALETVGPLRTLDRGYAIVTRASDGALIRSATQAQPGEMIEARVARGRLTGRVEKIHDD